jgi:hypothetical protein
VAADQLDRVDSETVFGNVSSPGRVDDTVFGTDDRHDFFGPPILEVGDFVPQTPLEPEPGECDLGGLWVAVVEKDPHRPGPAESKESNVVEVEGILPQVLVTFRVDGGEVGETHSRRTDDSGHEHQAPGLDSLRHDCRGESTQRMANDDQVMRPGRQ